MILSALLTSVGINLGLCLLFFTLYSILRKQPGNLGVYAPRLVAQKKLSQETDFNLERLLPSTGWIKQAWQPSEEDLLESSGLDGVVFMRIFVFSLQVFVIAAIIGMFILLPINFLGNQLVIDFSDLSNKSLDSFSISNVNNGSNRLWVHFCAAYIFTGAVCFLLYREYKVISLKRVAFFYDSPPQPHHFTILVRGIPATVGSSFSESVEHFFREYHPSTYLSHTVVRTSKLPQLVQNAEKMYKSIVQMRSGENTSQRNNGLFSCFRNKTDNLNRMEKKLEVAEDNIRKEQSSLSKKEVPAAFVSFKTRYGAAIALHIQQGVNPTEWVTEQAPEPEDVYWPFFSTSYLKRWIFKLVVIVISVVIAVLFLIPVVFVQGLTNLEHLEQWFPFLKSILTIAFVSQVITGYLPSLILQLFLYFIPRIMKMLSSIQGYISMSEIVKSACYKMLLFTIWNVFFANVLSGSALSQFNIFLDPKKVPEILAQAVPSQASFFISYVVTSGWTSLSSELVQLLSLVCNFLTRIFTRENDDDDIIVSPVSYESEIPRILSFLLLGITYFFLAPLILPFLLVYFCFGYLIFRNQLLNVYAPKYDTGGKFWPLVHNSTIFSLVLMNVIAIGLFGLKQLPFASTLTVPLPILTLLFNEYCRKRFLPIFKGYAAESLIKKDREEQNDPRMREFLDNLETAYEDPALRPSHFPRGTDVQSAPLLRSNEI